MQARLSTSAPPEGRVEVDETARRVARERDGQALQLAMIEQQIPGIRWFLDEELRLVSAAGPLLPLELPMERIAGMGLAELQAVADMPSDLASAHRRALVSTDPVAGETRVDDRVLEYRLVAVRDDRNRVAGVAGVAIDVTERRQAVERARELTEMKDAFLTAISHEMRTPLTKILPAVETLRARPDLPEDLRDRMLDVIAGGAARLDGLLADLLDVDRLERGVIEPRRHPVDISELVLEAVGRSTNLAGRAVNVSLDPVTVSVDPGMIERIVEHLLTNVGRHTPLGTPVWVRVEDDGGDVVLSVEDAGPGVPEPLRNSIFEPLQHGPTAPEHAPGTGIGLALVARFAGLLGGEAWVEDRDGGGAAFRIRLPAEPRAAAVAGPADVEDAPPSPGGARHLAPAVASVVRTLLGSVRRELDMNVAYLSVFEGDEQIVIATDGPGELIGISSGLRIPLGETYCARMVTGEIDNVIPETLAVPAVANLPATAGGLACYVGVPVHLPSGHLLGSLCVADGQSRPEITPAAATTLVTLARVLGDLLAGPDLLDLDLVGTTTRITDALVEPGGLEILFQPIVDLRTGEAHGTEALSRFPDDRPPDLWFGDATRTGLLSELELHAAERALSRLGELPEGCYLAVNLSPATIGSDRLAVLLAEVPLDRVVVEVSQRAIADHQTLEDALAQHRAAGLRLAVDDVTGGYASVRHLRSLRPEIVKVERGLIMAARECPSERAVLEAVVRVAGDLGADLVAEGIDAERLVGWLAEAGFSHAQGRALGEPAMEVR